MRKVIHFIGSYKQQQEGIRSERMMTSTAESRFVSVSDISEVVILFFPSDVLPGLSTCPDLPRKRKADFLSDRCVAEAERVGRAVGSRVDYMPIQSLTQPPRKGRELSR